MAKKKTYVKSLEQLEEAVAVQDVDMAIEPITESADLQKMSSEDMERFWRGIHTSNQLLLRGMIENVDRLIFIVTGRLRAGEEATYDLRDAEDAMYNLEEFSSRHRYTLPGANMAYVDRDVKLHLLSEINQLKVSGMWPIGSDGRGRQLNPMQQQVLWY